MSTALSLLESVAARAGRLALRRALVLLTAPWLVLASLVPTSAWGASAKPAISYSPASQVFTLGTSIGTLSPTNTGGAASSWTISPAPPAGLSFSGSTGALAGTPTALSALTSYTITATNASGSGTTTLKITVNAVTPVLSYSPDAETCTNGTPMTPLLPANGGGAVVTWSITPALSAGLSFSTANGEISGTPTAIKAATTYTVKGTNTGGSATTTFTLTVDDIPPAISYTPSSYTFTNGKAITAVAPTSTGGAVVSWDVSPSLPAGLTMSATTGKITGTPTIILPATAYTVTATNTGGSTTAPLTLTVNDKVPVISYSPATETYTYQTPIPVLSPTSTGGTVVTWSVSPALPVGLSLNGSTGQIAGTPTAIKAQTTYTITGANTGGSDSATVKITINDLTPAIGYSPATYLFVKGTTIAAITPTLSGGMISSWGVSPGLPQGLAFNAATGQITGTPAAVAAAASYTITAANGVGDAVAAITITVNDIPPVFGYSPASDILTKGTGAPSILPASTGGTVISWSIAPPLPAGLSLNGATGQVSGTPTVVSAATSYTVTGSNSGGSSTAPLALTVNDIAPAFSYPPSTFTLTSGTATAPILPASTGGTVVTWSVTPALPAGLAFNPGTGAITGTPSVLASAASFLVTGTNTGGTSTANLTLTVNSPPPVFTYTPSSVALTINTAATGITPVSTGGAVVSWSIAPATMPPGLTFSTTTGSITGTPTALSPAAPYTVTATNTGGTITAPLTLTVNDVAPAFTYTPASYGFPLGLPIAAITPASTGGTVLSWTITPALPTGLAFNSATGAVAGTPSAVSPATLYSVKGTNTGGSFNASFTLAVNLALPATPVISLPAFVTTGKPGLTASTPDQGAGTTYAWSLSSGTLTGGQGTTAITFTAGAPGPMSVTVTLTDPSGSVSSSASATVLPTPSAELALPTSVHPGDAWMKATVPSQPGSTYLWTILPGSTTATLTSGQGTESIGFTAGTTPGTFQIQANVQNQAGDAATATATVTAQTGTFLVENGGLAPAAYYATSTTLPSGRIVVAGGTNTTGPLANVAIYDPTAGAWVATGSLQTARANHAATLLPNGQVLVAGGQGASGTLGSVEIYDPIAETWTATAPLNTPRYDFTCTLMSTGQVLAAGGLDVNGNPLTSAEVYDPVAVTWTPVQGLFVARCLHTATALPNQLIMVAGGEDSGTSLSDVEMFNPTTLSWTTASPLPNQRFNHAATLMGNGQVLVTGGEQRYVTPPVYAWETNCYSCNCWSYWYSSGCDTCCYTYQVLVGGDQQIDSELTDAEIFDPPSGGWVSAPAMLTARTQHTATLMANGQVLVAGGSNSANGIIANAEYYDPTAQVWTAVYSLDKARANQTAALLPNGHVLVAGGMGSSGYALANSEDFDPLAGTWSIPAGLGLDAYAQTSTTLLNGKVLVAGGYSVDRGYLATAAIYDPGTRLWTVTGNLNTPRYLHTATLLPGGQVLVAGGANDTGDLSSVELYDPVAGNWTPITSLNVSRYGHTATLLAGGQVLVTGGEGGGIGNLNETEIYDPNAGTWNSAGVMSSTRVYHSATLLQNGQVLVAGGVGGPNNTEVTSVDIYDPVQGWAPTGPLTTPRNQHTAVLLQNGQVLVAGGYNAGASLANTEVYDPVAQQWTPTGSLGMPRYSHTCTLLPSGRVLVTGGETVGSTYIQAAEIFDPVTGLWTATGNLATPLVNHTANLLNDGTVLIAFGYGGEYSTEIYAPVPVPAPANLTYGTSALVLTDGVALAGAAPMETGGEATSYALSGTLPSGLVFNSATGVISGTTSVAPGAYNVVVTASNPTGSTSTGVTVTVDAVPPSGLTYSMPTGIFVTGVPIAPSTPSSQGGAVVYYTVSPPLPAGLNLDPGTGILTGTPAATASLGTYVVTATNSGGSTQTSLAIAVTGPPVAPSVMVGTYVTSGKPGLTASTPDQGLGMAYAWTLSGGTITAGQGTCAITYTPGAVGQLTAAVAVSNAAGTSSGSGTATIVPMPGSDLALATSVHPGDTWMQASLPAQPGMTYTWSIQAGTASGTLTAGPSPNVTGFSAGSTPGTFTLQATVQNLAGDQSTPAQLVTVQTGTWLVENGAMPAPQESGASVALADGRVLVIGGYNDATGLYLTNAQLYDPATGTWLATGSLNVARNLFTATLLANGQVLVAGGSNASSADPNGTILNSAEVFDPVAGSWSVVTGLGTARYGHSATLLNDGTVLVAGGEGTAGNLSSAELYDPSTGLWQQLSQGMNWSRVYHTATLLPATNQVLVAGGFEGSGTAITAAELYDPIHQSWGNAASLNTGRFQHTATLLPTGQVLVAGGTGPSGPVAMTELYDPSAATPAWTPVGTLGTPRYSHTATLLGSGQVLVAGGNDAGGNDLASAELFTSGQGWVTTGALGTGRTVHTAAILPSGQVLVAGGEGVGPTTLTVPEFYTPGAGTWSSITQLGAARSFHTDTLLTNGQVLVAGGYEGSVALSSAALYDPVARTWTATGSLNTARYQHTATLLPNGQVLVVGGTDTNGNLLGSMELYDPNAGTWTTLPPGLSYPRAGHTATFLPAVGQVLIAGGSGESGYLGISEVYDWNAGTWSQGPTQHYPRAAHRASLLPSGQVLVEGGVGYLDPSESAVTGYLVETELYDPTNSVWTLMGNLNDARAGHSATLLQDGSVLVTGGYGPRGLVASSELFPQGGQGWTRISGGNLNTPRYLHTANLLPSGQVLVAGGGDGSVAFASTELFDPIAQTWSVSGSLATGHRYNSATLLNDGTVMVAFGEGGDDVTEIFMPTPLPSSNPPQ